MAMPEIYTLLTDEQRVANRLCGDVTYRINYRCGCGHQGAKAFIRDMYARLHCAACHRPLLDSAKLETWEE